MQKQLLYIVLLFLVLIPAKSQLMYRPVKLDIGVSFGELTKHHAGFVSGYVEPKLNLSNHFTIGSRFDYVYFSQQDNPLTTSPESYNNLYWKNIESDGYIASWLATGEYYFSTHRLRPFIGGGAGFYYASLSEQNVYIDEDENLFVGGAMLRAGVNVDHIRFVIEYNLIPNDLVDLNYISIKLGFEIGGGKRYLLNQKR